MPKDRRLTSSSFDRAVLSPYSYSLKHSDSKNAETSVPIGDEREWNEVRCPICMEHPHNSVLLMCSCHEKGCRPFMCDTSSRLSNCLDQFRKSSASASSHNPSVEQQSEFVCPLCRGVVTRWIVIEEARSFMNSKKRSCSLETCNFVGNYAELRKHAWLEHPAVCPSVVSPTRQLNWTRLEQRLDIEDALAHQFDFDYNWDDWPSWEEMGEGDLLSDDSFLDLPSGMSDSDDDFVGLGGTPLFNFGSFLSSPEEEMVNSGSATSSFRLQSRSNITSLSSRSNNQGGDTLPVQRSQYNPTFSRLRSIDHMTHEASHRAIPRSLSSYYEENTNTNVRTRTGYYREIDSTDSRPITNNDRANTLASSRSRSSRGDAQPNSGASSRHNSVGVASPLRRAASR